MIGTGRPVWWWAFLGLIMLLPVLSACGATALPPTASPMRPSPTPTLLCDFFWSAEVQAWLDEDENGVYDPAEQPLAGIQFFADSACPGRSDRPTTDAEGYALLNFASSSCDCPDFSLKVKAEETDQFIQVSEDRVESEISEGGKYLFGFTRARESDTAGP